MPPKKVTAFQQKVYRATSLIPAGKITTYKRLALHIRCRSCRAVGQALRHNPFAPRVPCHRVIASNLTIGGFQGMKTGRAIRRKLALLAAEGVLFKNGRLADVTRLYKY
jgi:methylated-DNA-[protein]-cysteine S-methyltransferase